MSGVEGNTLTSDMYQAMVDRRMEETAGYTEEEMKAFMDQHAKYGLVGLPDAFVEDKIAGMDDATKEQFVNSLRDMDAAATERYMHDVEKADPETGPVDQARVDSANKTWEQLTNYMSPEHGKQFTENLYHASQEISLDQDLKGWTLLKNQSEAVYTKEKGEHEKEMGEDSFRDKEDIVKRAGEAEKQEEPDDKSKTGSGKVDRSKDPSLTALTSGIEGLDNSGAGLSL